MKKYIRGHLLFALLYQLLLVYISYSLCRLLFYLYNYPLFQQISISGLMEIFAGGLKFDTVAILYTNSLFILLSLIPFQFRHRKGYQRMLFYLFMISNGIALLANCADVPYYGFVLERTTFGVFREFSHESNLLLLTGKFIVDYWPIVLAWIILLVLLIWFYRRWKVEAPKHSGITYYASGILVFLLGALLFTGGVRGGFRHSTRPITMSNAGQYVKNPSEMALVLNTPFTLIKSINAHHYKRVEYFSNEEELEQIYTPLHYPKGEGKGKPNIVILIVESLNREFIGSLNPGLDSGSYEGYTPFLDSLMPYCRSYSISVANGRKSIEAMPSILAGIPTVEQSFILTPYYANNLESLPRLLGKMGYKSAFFHGAPNGSMGFQAFARSVGIEEYYGRDEYNRPEDFDGVWGVWDEPFLQYFAHSLDTFSQPFLATLFTVSSHHPFDIPEKYKGKFRKVDFPLQECVQYTDLALKKFFETASHMPWFSNTLFILTADHVSLNQRPEFMNEAGFFSIPVIFYQPGSDLRGIDSVRIAQQTDIMPTLLRYVGFREPFLAFGKDLFSDEGPNFAFNSLKGTFRLYKDDYFLIFDGKKSVQLFNLKQDPFLSRNLIDTELEVQASMERMVKAIIQQYKNRMIDDRLRAGE